MKEKLESLMTTEQLLDYSNWKNQSNFKSDLYSNISIISDVNIENIDDFISNLKTYIQSDNDSIILGIQIYNKHLVDVLFGRFLNDDEKRLLNTNIELFTKSVRLDII